MQACCWSKTINQAHAFLFWQQSPLRLSAHTYFVLGQTLRESDKNISKYKYWAFQSKWHDNFQRLKEFAKLLWVKRSLSALGSVSHAVCISLWTKTTIEHNTLFERCLVLFSLRGWNWQRAILTFSYQSRCFPRNEILQCGLVTSVGRKWFQLILCATNKAVWCKFL